MTYSLGSVKWAYICFLMVLSLSLLLLLDSLFLWLYNNSALPKLITPRVYRIFAAIIAIWGIIVSLLVGYEEFLKVKFSNENMSIEYLWPRLEIKIPFSQLSRYEIKIPPKVPENRRLIIYLKNGKKYKSTSDQEYRDNFNKAVEELDRILK